jgi:CRP-like cAMP-binding protein
MTDFLEAKKDEIRKRIDELRPAAEELARLEAALAALEGTLAHEPEATPPTRAQRRKPAGGGSNGRRGRPKGSGTRGKQALELVRERPGITIPELAEAMDIQQNYLYRVMPDLQKEGMVRKEGRGWHPLDAA